MLKEFRIVLVMALGFWCVFMLIGLQLIALGPLYVVVTWAYAVRILLADIVVGALLWVFRHKKPVICLRIGAACIVFILLTLLYFPLGKIVWKHDLARAEAYAVEMEPRIEAYKTAHGLYPDDLHKLPEPVALPRGLTYSSFTQEDRYVFSFPDWSLSILGGGIYLFDNHTRRWEYENMDD